MEAAKHSPAAADCWPIRELAESHSPEIQAAATLRERRFAALHGEVKGECTLQLQREYKAWTGFGSALARLLISKGDKNLSADDGLTIKQAIGSSYDQWADGALTLWNWGMFDEQLHQAIAARISDYDKYDSDGYSEQLYYYTFSQIPGSERSRRILEVGSGSGAGLNFLSRLEPNCVFSGVDLAGQAVERANARFSRRDRVNYLQGDAEKLPFADSTFDAVINVESSHNYPDVGAFLREVARVLKPGGYFSFVDFFTDDRLGEFEQCRAQVAALQTLAEHDISDAVRAAIRRRMDPHSAFRARVKKQFPLGTRFIWESSALIQYGSHFAGQRSVWDRLPATGLSDGLKVVAKLSSYRHLLARKL